MKGDFTRATFTPEKHYHGVLKQQGRVDMDADWNEQGAITSHRVETETVDVIGPCGAPVGDAGFTITAVSGGANLNISAGRAYVDGILCENEADVLITAQPDFPEFTLPPTPGTYLAYLEVWLRHIISLDDETIREVALGGPDTCTRAKTVWQVGLLNAGDVGVTIDCSTDVTAWDRLIAPSTGTLSARAEPDPTSDDICTIPAKAGFRRLENQLYRVEIHNAGDVEAGGGGATFKWSRDNGSVVTAWTAKAGNDLTVTSVGRDSVLGFAAGQWIELIDDSHELKFLPGTLVQLTNVQGLTLTINPATATGSVNFADFPLNPKIRRWDSAGLINLTTGTWIALEDGVQVEFSFGTYATADYWLIPARTLTGNVEWPLDALNHPIPEPPKGIHRHFCRLAVVQFDGTFWSVLGASCLPTFPPLTGLPTTGTDPGIHVLDVLTVAPEDGKLLNDSNLPFTFLREGIRVVCDALISPISVKTPTCFVTVDVPFPLDPSKLLFSNVVVGTQTIILPARVQASAQEIHWVPTDAQTLTFIDRLLIALNEHKFEFLEKRLLARLTLKGNVIWGAEDPTLFLDGEAFGVARGTNIGLQLPQSGNGKRGGDFEMWFWLTLPIQLRELTFPPNGVSAGQDAIGTITLSLAAPEGGVEIALSSEALDASGNPMTANIGTVPDIVSVAAGANSATFTVTGTSLPAGMSFATLKVTATYFTSSVQASLAITTPAPPVGMQGPAKIPAPKASRPRKRASSDE